MKITSYDSNGNIITNYELLPDEIELNIPSHLNWIEGEYLSGDWYIENGQPIRKPVRPDNFYIWDSVSKEWVDDLPNRIHEYRASKLDLLNEVTSRIRARFITPIQEQATVYSLKREESLRFLSDPNPDPASYPLIYAEVGNTGETAEQVAQIYLNMSSMFIGALAILEGARLRAVSSIENATNREQIETAIQQFYSDISVI